MFFKINNIKKWDSTIKNCPVSTNKYILEKIIISCSTIRPKKKIKVAIGNIKLNEKDIVSSIGNRWIALNPTSKSILYNILNNSYGDYRSKVDLLVLPELFIPVYWLKELVNFSKYSQIAIIAGLQYIKGKGDKIKNYMVAVFPSIQGNWYRNAFIFIREKNDYSPIEKESLARVKHSCQDAKTPQYQIFYWNSVNIATFLCYELTDITARALMKGKCDIIAAPVLNQDTTYFSNIIDSAVRDLHAFIIQANTSIYGDSRVTGPYDRDSKDIFKIKGGDNSNILIGTIDFEAIKQYQTNYYKDLERKVISLRAGKKLSKTQKIKPDIKKLPARFENSRAKRP